LHYPGDYGLIPQTLSEDDDSLDVLVLITNSTYPGILLEGRPIALLKMKDTQETDDKIPRVEVNDPRFASYKNVTDGEEHILKEIYHFFQVYKDLKGKKVEIVRWGSREEAMTIIRAAINSYNKAFGRS
jgi:inorganic pyrophosphatase